MSKSGKRKSKGRKKKKEVKLATTELLRGAETEKLLKKNSKSKESGANLIMIEALLIFERLLIINKVNC